jgi:hypothetical protein
MSALGRFFWPGSRDTFTQLIERVVSRNILPKRRPLNRVNSAFISGRIKVAQSIDKRRSTQQSQRVATTKCGHHQRSIRRETVTKVETKEKQLPPWMAYMTGKLK